MKKRESVEESIAQVNGSMAMEGMPLTPEDIAVLRRAAVSHEAAEKEIALLVEKLRSK
jgi:hypothetical protein